MNNINFHFTKSDIVFYTVMLFNDENKKGSLNGLTGSHLLKMKKHVNMCDLLCLSLNKFGYKHRIFTNSIQKFKELSLIYSQYDEIFHLDLSDKIDNSISFYLSMHKMEVSGLINNKNEYAIILDNDCVMLNDLPENYLNAINSGFGSVYEITNQVIPAFGLDNIMSDVTILNKNSNLGIWFGGEIFGGLSKHFQLLYESFLIYINKLNLSSPAMNHCSDENLYTNFIQEQMRSGMSFYNLGSAKVFARFWSCPTLHFPEHWNAICGSSILHLPGDKDFLSKYYTGNKTNFDSLDFISNYKKYLLDKGYQFDIEFFKSRKKRWFTDILKY